LPKREEHLEETVITERVKLPRNKTKNGQPAATLHVAPPKSATGETPKIVAIDRKHFTIGRSSACSLLLQDKKTSRIHAQIVDVGGKDILEDLGSVNGTKVNGQKIKKCVLEDGDIICIGDSELRYLAAK
jgi:pSer/pThr/pTyr-binding forkhead associated (FHA) protein